MELVENKERLFLITIKGSLAPMQWEGEQFVFVSLRGDINKLTVPLYPAKEARFLLAKQIIFRSYHSYPINEFSIIPVSSEAVTSKKFITINKALDIINHYLEHETHHQLL